MSTKKTLYHSELSKMGIVTARVNGKPQESKYPGKPKWVAIELDGEERYLNLENEECELAMTGFENDWVAIEARGSREEATLIVEPTAKPAGSADVKQQIADAKAKIAAMPDEQQQPLSLREKHEAAQAAHHKSNADKLADYAAHAGKIFALAWEESKNAMALIPENDAQGLSTYEWLDLRLRIASGFQIEINKIIRKERF